MRKIQAMSIHEFINGHFVDESFIQKAMQHIKRNKTFYITVGAYTIFFICCGFDASAAGSDIDKKAMKIYQKLISIGKWIVIIKTAFDVVQTATSGDFQGVKTKLIGYFIVFLTLLGLPWAFDQIDSLFQADPANG